MIETMSTVFTMIINGDIPGTFVHRDDRCVVFMSINPMAAGHALVERVAALVDDSGAEGVASFARKLYGTQVSTDLGSGDRDARLHRIRKYQFATNRPWLARIYDRDADGQVGPTWLVVERVTDEVTAMDPNPWNDIDETRRIPVDDFQVLWELDACAAVSV